MYLPFWGGNRGGCCHEKKGNEVIDVDAGQWGLGFTLDVIEVDPNLYESGNDFQFDVSDSSSGLTDDASEGFTSD